MGIPSWLNWSAWSKFMADLVAINKSVANVQSSLIAHCTALDRISVKLDSVLKECDNLVKINGNLLTESLAIKDTVDTLRLVVEGQNTRLDQNLGLLQKLGADMSAELDALTQQVQQNTNVEQSAVVLIQGIATQLANAKDDPAKVTALVNSLQASASALSAAITANTPSGPVVPPVSAARTTSSPAPASKPTP